MTTAIETVDLTKRFRSARSLRAAIFGPRDAAERVAVDGVNLSIPHGEVFGLLGQNGAGKTTLVRMLTTLLLPTSGVAMVDGCDLADRPDQRRRAVLLLAPDRTPEPRVLRRPAPSRPGNGHAGGRPDGTETRDG
jgi:ABC-type multidrug transport system ATPase subunit